MTIDQRTSCFSTPRIPSRRLKCLTLNVLASPAPHNIMEGERLSCLLEHVADYDIVVFQELIERSLSYNPAHKKRYRAFLKGLADAGFVHSVSGPSAHLLAVLDGGTAIFSKHKIIAASAHLWRKQASWDQLAAKGVVHAVVEIEPASTSTGASVQPVQVHVLTLHAQAAHVGTHHQLWRGDYQNIRLDQMRQISEIVQTVASDGKAVLLMGDFNFDAKDTEELRLHQVLLAQGTGRSAPPIDVVAASFKGEHPSTFGISGVDGGPSEMLLKSTDSGTSEECLDQVYFWPSEQDSSVSTPQASLMECAYTGPSNSRGARPARVSDHAGWKVEFDISFSTSQIENIVDCCATSSEEEDCRNRVSTGLSTASPATGSCDDIASRISEMSGDLWQSLESDTIVSCALLPSS